MVVSRAGSGRVDCADAEQLLLQLLLPAWYRWQHGGGSGAPSRGDIQLEPEPQGGAAATGSEEDDEFSSSSSSSEDDSAAGRELWLPAAGPVAVGHRRLWLPAVPALSDPGDLPPPPPPPPPAAVGGSTKRNQAPVSCLAGHGPKRAAAGSGSGRSGAMGGAVVSWAARLEMVRLYRLQPGCSLKRRSSKWAARSSRSSSAPPADPAQAAAGGRGRLRGRRSSTSSASTSSFSSRSRLRSSSHSSGPWDSKHKAEKGKPDRAFSKGQRKPDHRFQQRSKLNEKRGQGAVVAKE